MRRSWLAAFRQIGWSTKMAGFGNIVSALSATVMAEGSALSWRQMGSYHLQVAEVDGRPGWSFVAVGTWVRFKWVRTKFSGQGVLDCHTRGACMLGA